MSLSITLACLFALLHFHCAIENNYGSNTPTECAHDGESGDDQRVLKNSLTTGHHDDRYRVTKTIVYIDGDTERDDKPAESYPTSTTPLKALTLRSTAQPAGLGTDVILSLQEKLRNLANPANDKYIPIPEAWPVITLRIPRLTLPPDITPPLRTTRSFIDHFKTIKFTNWQLWNTNTKYFREPRSKDSDTAFTTRDMLFKRFAWTNKLTSSASWYDPGRFAWFPNTPDINNIGKVTDSWENNPWMKIHDLMWLTRVNAITLTLNTETTSEPHFLLSPTRKHGFILMEKTIPILRENITSSNTTNTTTTTTTTRTTRTYPYPDWVCYECGKNETRYGSSFCYDIFEGNGKARNYTKLNLHYKCNGHLSVVYQCFKRFLDVGDYNERGCRDWPPRKSGRTFASRRLRALEKVLRGVKDGCVFSPNAALVPFSHTVQLYARFHVCVCEGHLCNTAGPYGPSSVVIFIVILIFKV